MLVRKKVVKTEDYSRPSRRLLSDRDEKDLVHCKTNSGTY